MTDRHREISDNIVKRLKTANSVDEYELRKIGGEVYDVMKWLKNYEIIDQTETGQPFTKGNKFTTYTNLDDLLDPPAPKKDLLDRFHKVFAIGGVLFAVVTGTITLTREGKYQRTQDMNSELKSFNDSLSRKNISLDSLVKINEGENLKMRSQIDSLTNNQKTNGKKEK
jgi:hypothetical protein